MAADYKDYYKILEIPKTADDKEIKAAYRKLARKYHPDVNQNDKASEEKFKEIGEAYEVLSDKEKRAKYDQYGDQWKEFSQAGGFNGYNGYGFPGGDASGGFRSAGGYGGGAQGFGGLDDLFSSLFGDAGRGSAASGFGGGFRVNNRQRPAANHRQNIDLNVEISLEEAYAGTTRSFNLGLPETCTRCSGRGTVPATGSKNCPSCDGTGKARGQRGIFAPDCPQCGGTGQATEMCPDCKGAGTIERKKRLSDVKIPAGIKHDQRIRLAGQGSGGSDILKVSVRPDVRFERKGDDLHTEFNLPFTVAALGGQASVETLEGRKVVSIPPGTQSGANFRLTGLGMPTLKGGVRGNLYAKAKLTVPKDLSPRERDLLYEIAKLRKDEVKVGG
jgi:chaperone protein DnaJ